MAAILVINVKGVTLKEISNNSKIINEYMNSKQSILHLVSDIKANPGLRIYYSNEDIVPKDIRSIISDLRTNKKTNVVIESMFYHASLNKV